MAVTEFLSNLPTAATSATHIGRDFILAGVVGCVTFTALEALRDGASWLTRRGLL